MIECLRAFGHVGFFRSVACAVATTVARFFPVVAMFSRRSIMLSASKSLTQLISGLEAIGDRYMLNARTFFLCSVALAVALSGCGGSPTRQGGPQPAGTAGQAKEKSVETPASPNAEGGDHVEHAGHSDAQHEAMAKGLAELSNEDRVLAEKQHTCPVSGDMLGVMGTPVKVSIKGRTVFLCCSNCEADLKKDPDKFLAKVKTDEAK